MSLTNPIPSNRLKALAGVARWALGVLTFLWLVLIAAWIGLHFLIVPRIADFRPALERQATQQLGVSVKVGAVMALSNGFIPSLELRDVALLDSQGREALRLPSVLAALSPRSIFSGGFEQLYVEGPVLDVRRSADGRLWVAGLPLLLEGESNGLAADWIFSQAELVVRHGTVHWTDEVRNAPPVSFSGVDVVLRNSGRAHAVRLDMEPPQQWGEPIQVMGQFSHPSLARNAGQWRDWDGQLFCSLPSIDLSAVRPYVDFGVRLDQGVGAMRAWLDVRRGSPVAVTADVALADARVQVAKGLAPLEMHRAAGRLGFAQIAGGIQFFTQGLAFESMDATRWPGGNVRVNVYEPLGAAPARGDLVADRLDLGAMAHIADHLPIPGAVRDALTHWSPKGQMTTFQMSWTGDVTAVQKYTAQGTVKGLGLLSWARPTGVLPGLNSMDVQFDANQSGGSAKLTMRKGGLDLTGYLDEPTVSLDRLDGTLAWVHDTATTRVTGSDLRFANADGQGDLQFTWAASLAKADAPETRPGRALGTLDLTANVSQVNVSQLHRYLPIDLDRDVRTYLKDALVSGVVSAGKIKIKGPLALFPFADPQQGQFQVSAALRDTVFAFAPASVTPAVGLPWPALSQLSGELTIDAGALRVQSAKSKVLGFGGLEVVRAEARITDLYGAAGLTVSADAQGPLAEAVSLVNTSPLLTLTNKVLVQAKATGPAQYQFTLGFPLASVDRAVVQGSVILAGNDINITPDAPRMTRARGTLVFSENGFGVNDGQVRALGGDAKIDGVFGTVVPGPRPAQQGLRIQGTATAQGLRQATELGWVASLGRYASGTTNYTAALGIHNGALDVVVATPLTGMALALPAPFSKSADAALPIRFEIAGSADKLPVQANVDGGNKAPELDQIKVDIGQIASVVYQRDVSGVQARVLRGTIAAGLGPDETSPMPASGIVANVKTPALDLDAWAAVLALPPTPPTPPAPPNAGLSEVPGGARLPLPTVSPADTADSGWEAALAYAPTSLALRVQELKLGGRTLNRVLLGGTRQGPLWRANLDADELNGYVEYRQPTDATMGRLFARLDRLTVGPSEARAVESLMDVQPSSIPALDVVVNQFELKGKKLGRLELDAVNLAGNTTPQKDTLMQGAAREWRLNRFNITTPEATLVANGNWTSIVTLAQGVPGANVPERRRTALKFKLDIQDAGALLERFGLPGVVRGGKGSVGGRIGWLGSPINFDSASLGGAMNVAVQDGQFLKTEPGIGRLLGVLSLQALPRRLSFDFRDVFSDGFAFDFFRGDIAIDQGLATTSNLQMKGVTAAVVMEGQADIAQETQRMKVLVVPEVSAGNASLLASYINPVWGLGSFLAQWIVRKPLTDSLTQEFLIDGPWGDPRVTKVERK